MIEDFIARKHGKGKITYELPQREPILADTYGVTAYQEQVMRIASELAGFTLGEADLLRKAMGKKKADVMQSQRQKFLDGARARGIGERKAARIFDLMEHFAGYGFNKSHSTAYALLAYQTAYLKAHHPVEFMAALLTNDRANTDKVVKDIGECREMGIPVLPPDVNESDWAFGAVGDRIRFGLGGVKGLGEAAVEAVLEARRRLGGFRSFGQLVAEVDPRAMNQKVFEALVKSGSCDRFGAHRAALCASIERMVESGQRRRREVEEGQGSLFAGDSQTEPAPSVSSPPWPEADRLRFEKEALGFYLTGNPLLELEDQLRRLVSHTTADLRDGFSGEATVGGLVTRLKRAKIKSGPNAGRVMGRFVLEDLEGSLSVTLFADQLQKFEPYLVEEAPVLVRGQVRDRGSETEMTAEEVVPLARAAEKLVTGVRVTLDRELSRRELLELRDLLTEHPGEAPVVLAVRLEQGGAVEIAPPERFRIDLSPQLLAALEGLVGAGRVVRLGI